MSGYDKAVRFRMVNQFKNDEINLLWHSALRLALIAEKRHNNKIDVWSVGILTYELLFGRVPFESLLRDFIK